MVYDYNTWMPGDGSLHEWLDAHQPKESEYIHYFVGCDLGKKRDPSAIAVIESYYTAGNPTYLVSYLHRFSLSMLYTDIASKLAELDEQLKEIAAKQEKTAIVQYALDATGLGGPICELVEKALPLANLKKVYITGGINTTEGSTRNEYHVPKGQLVSGLMAAFDSKTIHITRRSKEIDAIVDELTNFEIHISEAGRDSYNAAPSKHDDLLISLCLACWLADMDGDSSGPIIW